MEGSLGLSLGQATGLFVTFIYGFGTDLDVVFAIPVGFFVGTCVAVIEELVDRALARRQTA